MQSKGSKRLKAGVIILASLAILYVGHCTGMWGKHGRVLQYAFQCSCPRFLENIRIRRLYSKHAEIIFSACDDIGPIPSPSGQKVAVINFEEPDESYVWFLQTGERIPFTWLGIDLDWLADDLLFVRTWSDMNVVDLVAEAEYSITMRTNVRQANGEIDPSVFSALREARYVILTTGEVAAISPDALASSEHSFAISYDEFGYTRHYVESYERMRQFLQDQDIDYLDYIDTEGTDILSLDGAKGTLVSPDGRFFYRNGTHLVETGEEIVDPIPGWLPIGWVYDGVIVRRSFRGDYLIDILPPIYNIKLCKIRVPILKLQVPSEYNVSDTSHD